MENFINVSAINTMLEAASNVSNEQIEAVLNKAAKAKGLTPDEVATLLMIEDETQVQKLYDVAGQIKDKIYGNRVVLFAPLYISNFCKNNCTYCGYKRDNQFLRKKLTRDQIIEEVACLERLGHKRLALEVGEDHVNCDMDYILNAIDWIYEAGDIRRINVNIAATTTENYRRLKEKEIGTYILFQETYDPKAYANYHPQSLKGDYERQLFAFHRAMEAGIDDVGGGVLFGLSDYRFEVMSLVLHNLELEKIHHVGFHTVSVPRLKKAEGMDLSEYENIIDDETFKKIVTILRLAMPYTGIILSTRETKEMRHDLIRHGVTQISAGSQTGVGGYKESEKHEEVSQFELSDERSPIEVIKELVSLGFVPSYCTACYRMGRTGDHFMEIVRAGKIGSMCAPNALLTLNEYARDYGDRELREMIQQLNQREIEKLPLDSLKEKVEEGIKKISNGKSDLYV